jgi:diacylglycerol kinase (ATP)
MARRALLLVNRHARQGKESSSAEELKQAGFDIIEESGPREAITETIRKHREHVELVIVAGGDGSLNAAAAGLMETKLPLGIIPLGTANDLARTLEIPLTLADACQVIAAGKTKPIDLGQANDQYFFNVASIGLAVDITKALDKQTKRVWGRFAYAKTAFNTMLRARTFWAEIKSGTSVTQVRSLQIAVGNGRYYGGGMPIARDAAIDDQRLDLYSLECRRWWRLLWLAPWIWLGYHGEVHDVRALADTEFAIRTRRPLPVNADGEIVTHTPVQFRVLPKALTVFVP